MHKEKSPPKSPLWENNKKPGSGSYFLAHGRISWRKLTKFGKRLAKCNFYLCYFFHKVKIVTPSCHKRAAQTVISIRFVITNTRAHYFSEFDQSGQRTSPLLQQSPTLPQAVSTTTRSRTRSSFHHLSGLRTLLLIHRLSGSSIWFTIHFRSGLKHQFTIHLCSCLKHRFFPITSVCHPSILCVKKKAHQRAHFEKNRSNLDQVRIYWRMGAIRYEASPVQYISLLFSS